MDIKEELKNLSNQDLKNIYWLIFRARKITGKNMEEEIIKNYLMLNKLLKLDELIKKYPNEKYKKEAKTIENMLLRDMRRKLEKGG